MTVSPGSAQEARLLVALQERLVSAEARAAFAFLHLNFARLAGCVCEVEAHGVVSSLRVRDQGAWCYSFSTARDWVLAYVRPPEYRRCRIRLHDLQQALPAAEDRGDEHLRVRISTLAEAQRFFTVVAAARQNGGRGG